MKQPNILFLMADQMRHDALGCNGNPVISTPNYDRLAASGVNFSNSFSTNPLCVPPRANPFGRRRYGAFPENLPFPGCAMLRVSVAQQRYIPLYGQRSALLWVKRRSDYEKEKGVKLDGKAQYCFFDDGSAAL